MEESYGQLIEPAPVPFHFGAPGWYVLAGLLMLSLACLAWLWWSWRKRNAYRREAVRLLDAITGKGDDLYEANMLMKRIAMSKYGRAQTAALEKKDWIDFLNNSARKEIFGDEDAGLLQALYSVGNKELPATDFLDKSKHWIMVHKRIKQ